MILDNHLRFEEGFAQSPISSLSTPPLQPIFFQRPDIGLKTSGKPRLRQGPVLKPFSRGLCIPNACVQAFDATSRTIGLLALCRVVVKKQVRRIASAAPSGGCPMADRDGETFCFRFEDVKSALGSVARDEQAVIVGRKREATHGRGHRNLPDNFFAGKVEDVDSVGTGTAQIERGRVAGDGDGRGRAPVLCVETGAQQRQKDTHAAHCGLYQSDFQYSRSAA